MNIESDLYTIIYKSIEDWVGKNFGSQELEDPSWNIDELSKHIVKTMVRIDNNNKSLHLYYMSFTIKDMKDEERGEIASKIVNKLERMGGSIAEITYNKGDFREPIKGETKGIEIKVKVDLPNNFYQIRGFMHWVERMEDGHGIILRYDVSEEQRPMGEFIISSEGQWTRCCE